MRGCQRRLAMQPQQQQVFTTVRPRWVCEAGQGGVEQSEETGPFEGEEIEAIGDDSTENGRRNVRRLLDPKLPSAEEVRVHGLTHLPYRNWCPHCVRGRGREMDHQRKSEEDQGGVPEYHMDYCFPGDEEGQKLVVLAVVERRSRMKRMVVVPSKGSTGTYAVKAVLELMEECGDRDAKVIVKSDQEPAIKFLIDDVCVHRTSAQTIVEQAPKGSKGSNGVIERAVQSMEQQVRTMKSALEERMGVRVDVRHPILSWMCDYAGFLLNRLEVSADGKTAYERNKGKRAQVLGLEFGERVLWKHGRLGAKMEKINARWSYGMFLGVKVKSGELIILDFETETISYVRTVRRVPEEQRWSAEYLGKVLVVPWNRGAGDGEADGDAPEYDARHGPGRALTAEEKEQMATETADAPRIVHRAHLKKADFDRFGYSDRCGGCSAILRGLHIQPHTSQCRARIEGLLEGDLRVMNAKARFRERTKRVRGERSTTSVKEEKKRKLDEIEQAVEAEEDHEKLAELFEKYRRIYQDMEVEGDEVQGAKRGLTEIENEAMQTDDSERVKQLYQEYMEEHQKQKAARTGFREAATSSGDHPQYSEDADIDQVMMEEWVHIEQVEEREVEKYAWDDVNDIPLPLEKVIEARREEIGFMKGKTFEVVKIEEALRVTGKKPIGTRWVDTDKSHGVGEMVVRSRWVARDFKDKKEKDRHDLFSATPPVEIIRYMLSRQATKRQDGRERKSMYIDVKKAHLMPRCEQDVYVDLPEEADVAPDECGKLLYWLYGCRPAARAWEEHYSGVMEGEGFARLKSSPVAFAHNTRDLVAVCHGDDFVFVGLDEDLEFAKKMLAEHYEIKVRGVLGFGPNDVREINNLGRVIKLHEWGITSEGDPRHKDLIMKHFGLGEKTKVLTKNGYKDEGERREESVPGELSKEEVTVYRMLAARLNYMSQDDPSVQYPTKEICRTMSAPESEDFGVVKKLARFMMGVDGVKWEFKWQSEEDAKTLRVYADSDWAGCLKSRRSTSGGVMVLGAHPLRTWASTQKVVATSSSEAELYSMAEAASRALGMRSALEEFGSGAQVVVATDSSAAKAFASTRGLGKMRHLEVKDLWIQGLVQDGRIKLKKVAGADNPADAMTKFQDRSSLVRLLALVGIRVASVEGFDRAEGGCEESL